MAVFVVVVLLFCFFCGGGGAISGFDVSKKYVNMTRK